MSAFLALAVSPECGDSACLKDLRGQRFGMYAATCQDSSMNTLAPQSMVSFGCSFLVSVSSVSISPECGDSLFDQCSQRFVIYAHVPGFLVLLRHQGANSISPVLLVSL